MWASPLLVSPCKAGLVRGGLVPRHPTSNTVHHIQEMKKVFTYLLRFRFSNRHAPFESSQLLLIHWVVPLLSTFPSNVNQPPRGWLMSNPMYTPLLLYPLILPNWNPFGPLGIPPTYKSRFWLHTWRNSFIPYYLAGKLAHVMYDRPSWTAPFTTVIVTLSPTHPRDPVYAVDGDTISWDGKQNRSVILLHVGRII